MNALGGDTYVFAEIDGKYGVYTLKELFEQHKQGHKIKVPTLLNERGEKGWVEVENVVSFKKQPLKRITLAISRVFVEVFQNTIIPAYSNHLFLGKEEQINPKLKRVNELKNIQDPRYNNTLLLATYIPLNIPDGDQKDYDYGFALGFFLSEGNLKYRKRKNTKRSLAKLNGFARKKGMTLEEYLNYMTNIQQVVLSVGQSDFERGYIQILQKHFKFSKPSKKKHANAYSLCSTDLSFFHLIKDYTEGNDSHTKRLKNEAFNQSMKFLEGIFDGFTRGDGHYNKNSDWIQVEITTNYLLYYDLIFIARVLGYDIHVNNGRFRKSPLSNNYYYNLRLSVSKRWHRHVALGLVREHIKKIEDAGEREAFNLVVKPLYPENDKRSVFNHLFFTAYGFLVSDAVKVLDRSVLKTSLPVLVSG